MNNLKSSSTLQQSCSCGKNRSEIPVKKIILHDAVKLRPITLFFTEIFKEF